MKIYIASSWKNQHAVEMLTTMIRAKGKHHTVISWVENNYGEQHNHVTKKMDFETWVNSPESEQSFEFDTRGATTSDLVIYVAPSGKDAAAEVGAAWANGVPVIGLFAKGEDFGLMRKMMHKWFQRYTEVLDFIDILETSPHAWLSDREIKDYNRERIIREVANYLAPYDVKAAELCMELLSK